MNLRRLKFFVTVAEELHFGRAAERLCMTQPPLSQAILALEEELSVTLFKRTKRNVALTPVGEHLLSHVTKLLEDVEALPGLARQLSRGEIGSLKLGFVTTADYNLLPDLISHYGATYPDVKVSLKEMTSDLQVEALLQGEINAGLIIPLHATLHASLAYLPLLREPLVAAVPEEWVRRGRIELAQGRLRLQDVAEAPLVLFPRRSAPAFHDIITTYFVTNGIQPTIGQEAIQMQTIISLVSAGMGIALVPGSLKRLGRQGVVYVDLDGEPPMIETGLVWRRDDPSPTVTRLVEISQAIGEQAAAPAGDPGDPVGACAPSPPVGGSPGVVLNGHGG
ncbi:MAG: LysR family transcriptional regulator [Rhodobacteraceae bacterium]|nr:LysR family transcriptional regulator [Paracoccaceae bacterium]